MRESWDNPTDWYQTNVVGIGRFIDAIAKLDHIERYFHISTPEVYGNIEHDYLKTNLLILVHLMLFQKHLAICVPNIC